MVNLPTIKYDVGSTIYKITKDIIDKHPNSMLARMASDEWNVVDGSISKPTKKSKRDEYEALFINGIGVRFQYILDYLVRGKVKLPKSVPKQALLDDLEYYGVEGVDTDAIQESSVLICESMDSLRKKSKKLFRKLDLNVEVAAAKRLFAKVAYYCFTENCRSGRTSFRIYEQAKDFRTDVYTSRDKDEDRCYCSEQDIFNKYKHMLNDCLAEYGFRCVDIPKACLFSFSIETIPNEEQLSGE